jgi:hypothetical protein
MIVFVVGGDSGAGTVVFEAVVKDVNATDD